MSLNSPFLELCLHRALVSFQPLCRALSSSPSSCEAHEPSCTHPSLSLALAHSQRKLNFWRRVSTVVIMQDVKTDPWQLRSFPYASQQPAGLIAEELVQGKFEKPCGAKRVSVIIMYVENQSIVLGSRIIEFDSMQRLHSSPHCSGKCRDDCRGAAGATAVSVEQSAQLGAFFPRYQRNDSCASSPRCQRRLARKKRGRSAFRGPLACFAPQGFGGRANVLQAIK